MLPGPKGADDRAPAEAPRPSTATTATRPASTSRRCRKPKKLAGRPAGRRAPGAPITGPRPDRRGLPRPGLGRQAALRRQLQQGAGEVLARHRRGGPGLGPGLCRAARPGARVVLVCPPLDGVRRDGAARTSRRARRWSSSIDVLGVGLRPRRRHDRAKSERLLNLVILLLVARNYTTKDQIRELMEPYREGSPTRRSTGCSSVTRTTSARSASRSRPATPTSSSRTSPATGSSATPSSSRPRLRRPTRWPCSASRPGSGAHAGLAAATSDALVKLKAAGLSFDREQLDHVQPTPHRGGAGLRGRVPGHRPPHARSRSTTAARARATPTRRHVQPWGVVTAQGRWYVAGLDTDRGEPRMFRLSRITSDVVTDGAPGSFTVPEGTDLRAMSQRCPARPDRARRCSPAPGAANGLRRRASVVDTGRRRSRRRRRVGPARGALRRGGRVRRGAAGVRRHGARRVAGRAARRRRDRLRRCRPAVDA